MPGDADGGLINVLLIEDDERLARLVARYLEGHGLLVTCAADGGAGLSEALSRRYHVILLDIMIPVRDGLEVCREIRGRSDVPLIMVTARDEEASRVLGLELGADDYIAKPFSSPELLARIRAVVRRARGQAGPPRQVVKAGPLVLDTRLLEASFDQRPLHLTSYEFELLRVLAERSGRALSREELLDLAKGRAEDAFERSIDVHISRLRRKLGDDPRRPRLLKTVRGVGYLLAIEVET